MAAVTSRKSAPKASELPPAKKARHSKASTSSPQQNGLLSLLSETKDGKQLSAVSVKNARDARKGGFDESRAVVGSGIGGHADVNMQDAAPEVVEISSDDDKDSDDDSLEDEAEAERLANGVEGDEVMDDAEDEPADEGADDEEGAGDPSFGELLRANNPEPVDVEAFEDPVAQSDRALAPTSGNRVLSAPSATSLGTVLTQALKTNDKELLESCFEMNDLDSIRSTIERLHSSLVANLLQKLAERLHRRPGRAGNLMIWVQWALVSHGGYLAGQPEVMRRLTSLNRVIKERASGLQPLLTLKGKLDMLSAQMELRRNIQRTTAAQNNEDDPRIIYVEGEESSDEEEEQVAGVDAVGATDPLPKISNKQKSQGHYAEIGESESSDNDMPVVNGVSAEADSGEEESEDEDLVDDEAEETDDDEGDDISEGEEESSEDGEDVLSEEDSRPTKRSKAALRSSFGRRR